MSFPYMRRPASPRPSCAYSRSLLSFNRCSLFLILSGSGNQLILHSFFHPLSFDTHVLYGQRPDTVLRHRFLRSSYQLDTLRVHQHIHYIAMAEVVAQQGAALAAPLSRQDVVSELLDDYTYQDSYGAEDVLPESSLAPAFKELPSQRSRTDSVRDPKVEAIQRMNTKFQLRGKPSSCKMCIEVLEGAMDPIVQLLAPHHLYASAFTVRFLVNGACR
jgi:hypothetical protein